MSSNLLPGLIFFGALALVIVLIVVVILVVRQETVRKEKLASEMGFSPVEDPDKLRDHLAYVNPGEQPERLSLTYVFRRQAGGGEIYLYNLHRRNINHDRIHRHRKNAPKNYAVLLERDAFAFIAPGWNLPCLTITPRWEGKGKLLEIANRINEAVIGIKATRLDFSHIPGLDEKYNLATTETGIYDVNLSEVFLRSLAANPGLILRMGGDALTVSHSKYIENAPDDDGVRWLYKLARQLAKEIRG